MPLEGSQAQEEVRNKNVATDQCSHMAFPEALEAFFRNIIRGCFGFSCFIIPQGSFAQVSFMAEWCYWLNNRGTGRLCPICRYRSVAELHVWTSEWYYVLYYHQFGIAAWDIYSRYHIPLPRGPVPWVCCNDETLPSSCHSMRICPFRGVRHGSTADVTSRG